MSTDLFGVVPPENPPPERRKRAGSRAYPAPPGTGPEGKRCRDCSHYARNYSRSGRSFPKCDRVKWSCGRATDIRAGSPACRLFEPAAPPIEGTVTDPATAAASQVATGGPESQNTECPSCDGLGYTSDLLGGCGDPECCGGPVKVKCYQCDNDWSEETRNAG